MSRCEGLQCEHPECDRQRRQELEQASAERGPMAHRRLEPTAAELEERDHRQDPVVKYDGDSRPVRLSAMGMNRAQRRRWLRGQRRTKQ